MLLASSAMASNGGETIYKPASMECDSMPAKERKKLFVLSTGQIIPTLVYSWFDIALILADEHKCFEGALIEIT